MEKLLRTQVRIPMNVAVWVKECAQESERSMNAQINFFLKEAMRRDQKPRKQK